MSRKRRITSNLLTNQQTYTDKWCLHIWDSRTEGLKNMTDKQKNEYTTNGKKNQTKKSALCLSLHNIFMEDHHRRATI